MHISYDLKTSFRKESYTRFAYFLLFILLNMFICICQLTSLPFPFLFSVQGVEVNYTVQSLDSRLFSRSVMDPGAINMATVIDAMTVKSVCLFILGQSEKFFTWKEDSYILGDGNKHCFIVTLKFQHVLKCTCGNGVAEGVNCARRKSIALGSQPFFASSVRMEVGSANVSSWPTGIMLSLISSEPGRDMEEDEISSFWFCISHLLDS